MHPVITAKQADIDWVCQAYGVRRLELFGSAARGYDFNPEGSDIDFVVEFSANSPAVTSLQSYLAFQRHLSNVLGHSVDLLAAEKISNPYIRAEIDRCRESVYAA